MGGGGARPASTRRRSTARPPTSCVPFGEEHVHASGAGACCGSDRLPSTTCSATTVHYGATRVGVPWIKAGGFTGHLFAYGARTLMDGRVNGSDGLVLYTGGGSADPAMKVLWTARRRPAAWLVLSGHRVDAA